MNYLISKRSSRHEYRIFSSNDFDGKVIYSGHKMAINDDILFEILDYKVDRSKNEIYYLNYSNNKLEKGEIDHNTLFKYWGYIINSDEAIARAKKITVVKVNI